MWQLEQGESCQIILVTSKTLKFPTENQTKNYNHRPQLDTNANLDERDVREPLLENSIERLLVGWLHIGGGQGFHHASVEVSLGAISDDLFAACRTRLGVGLDKAEIMGRIKVALPNKAQITANWTKNNSLFRNKKYCCGC